MTYFDKAVGHIDSLSVLEGQQVRAEAVEVGAQLVKVHHVGIGFEDLPIAFPVGPRELDGHNVPTAAAQRASQPERQLQLCARL